MRWLLYAILLIGGCGSPPPPGGATVEDLMVQAKNTDCDPMVEFYDQLQLQPIALHDYHARSDLSYLLIITVAGWCDACNHEQPQIGPLMTKYRARGLRVLEVLMQGYNEVTADAATETDLNHWATVHSLSVGLALDPSGKVGDYVDLSVSPSTNMLVRLSDMQIVHRAAGEEMLDPVIATFLP